MVLWTTLSAVAAVPAGFKVAKQGDICTVHTGPALANGVVPMFASCRWTDVDLAKVNRLFSPWQDHDVFFSSIAASDVERTEGAVAYVRQVHRAKGISDRECVLAMEKTTLGPTTVFKWAMSAGGTVSDGRVPVAHDVGYWHFTPVAEGGLLVEHYLEYGPGGSVPGFMVRAFQAGGFEAGIHELHGYLRTH